MNFYSYLRTVLYKKGKGGNIIKSKYCYFVNNGEFFYIGQILRYYDCHGAYLMNVEILKFIKHFDRKKKPYTCVQVRFLDGFKSHVYTFNASKFLGFNFTNKTFLETFKNSIDKK